MGGYSSIAIIIECSSIETVLSWFALRGWEKLEDNLTEIGTDPQKSYHRFEKSAFNTFDFAPAQGHCHGHFGKDYPHHVKNIFIKK
jgi:hypothetical protein